MDHQLQIAAKITNALPYLKKLLLQDRRLPAAAAVYCEDSPSSAAYCAICLDDDIRGCGGYRRLPECGHCFHAECIDAWLRSHATCPLCRTQLPQIIEINDHQFGALVSNIVLLFHSFVDKMCNPLNDELASMLCSASLR